jgi:hypothetical protein
MVVQVNEQSLWMCSLMTNFVCRYHEIDRSKRQHSENREVPDKFPVSCEWSIEWSVNYAFFVASDIACIRQDRLEWNIIRD